MPPDGLTNFTAEDLLKARPALYKYACRLVTAQNADDLVQQVCLRAIEKQHLFVHDTNLKSWLMTMMHNKFTSNYRAEARRHFINHKVSSDTTNSCIDESVCIELNVLITEATIALASIPKHQLDVLRIIGLQGHSQQECADELHIPIGTVRSRLSRAHKMLKAALH